MQISFESVVVCTNLGYNNDYIERDCSVGKILGFIRMLFFPTSN